jgi:hypothetical protein
VADWWGHDVLERDFDALSAVEIEFLLAGRAFDRRLRERPIPLAWPAPEHDALQERRPGQGRKTDGTRDH